MIRTTFPDENQAWKKEVERMLSTLTTGQRGLAQQAGGAIQTSGVVIGGVAPSPPKECMQFEFKLNGTSATDCRGCISDCKTVHIPSDLKGIRRDLGESTESVIVPAGDYLLKRVGSVNDCTWRYGDLATDDFIITWASPGGSTDGTGMRTSVLIESIHVGSLYYYNELQTEDFICDSVPYADKDPDWTVYASTLTISSHDCDDPSDTPDDCADGLDVKAEIKWDESTWSWIQSYFTVNGKDGTGSVTGEFDGGTFIATFTVNDSYCAPGIANVSYKAPVFVDQCRNITARRADYAPGWPSTITGKCVDCTPNSTTTSTSTDSTTTGSTTGSTTTGSTTTGSTTTGSTTTGSTTGSTTTSTSSSTTDSTTGSTSTSTTSSTTTGSSSSSSSTTGNCTGACSWIGVPDSGCSSPTGFMWSGNGNSCSGCSTPPCSVNACATLVSELGRWPAYEGDTISHSCI